MSQSLARFLGAAEVLTMKVFFSSGVCFVAALAAGCSSGASHLGALADGAVEAPAGLDARAAGSGGSTGAPDAPIATGGSSGRTLSPPDAAIATGSGGGFAGVSGTGGTGAAGGMARADAAAASSGTTVAVGGAGGFVGAGGVGGGQVDAATGGAPAACVPGQSVACACPTGQPGAQICTSAGTFAACVCWSPPVDAEDAGEGGVTVSADAACGSTTASLAQQPADLLLVLDRTGSLTRSMDSTANCPTGSTTCQQRWATLVHGLNSVLSVPSGSVNWGLEVFNSDGSCGVDPPEVPVAPGAAAAVQAYIAGIVPSGSTPTRLAIDTAVTYLKTLTDPNAKSILLATDGEPTCQPDGGTEATEMQRTQDAVTAAFKAGFKVYVIGLGPETVNLSALAYAGGTYDYYSVLTPDSLTGALSAIVGSATSCTFGLGRAPPDPSNVVVEFNSDTRLRVPRDTSHSNGWDYTSPDDTTIALYGSWCDGVTRGDYTSAQMIMGCPSEPFSP
jgi:hypothetical protein